MFFANFKPLHSNPIECARNQPRNGKGTRIQNLKLISIYENKNVFIFLYYFRSGKMESAHRQCSFRECQRMINLPINGWRLKRHIYLPIPYFSSVFARFAEHAATALSKYSAHSMVNVGKCSAIPVHISHRLFYDISWWLRLHHSVRARSSWAFSGCLCCVWTFRCRCRLVFVCRYGEGAEGVKYQRN